MSGSSAFERAQQSFSANTSAANSQLGRRNSGLMEKYQNQVRGYQDNVANIKATALQAATEKFQGQVEQGKQLSEGSIAGFAAFKGAQKARKAYKGAKTAFQARKADAAAKARETSGASEKGGDEPDVGNLDDSAVPSGDSAVVAPQGSTSEAMGLQDGKGGESLFGSDDVEAGAGDGRGLYEEPGSSDVADSAGTDAADVAESAGTDATDAVTSAAGDAADAATSYAADLATTASDAATSASNSISSALTSANDAADSLSTGLTDLGGEGGSTLLQGALDLGGVDAAESAGLVAAFPEVIAAGALVAGIGYGLYDIFHHGKPNAPPELPSAPVMAQGASSSAALTNARNAFVTPSFDSVIDTPAASAAF